jgi:cation transport regulator ChaC
MNTPDWFFVYGTLPLPIGLYNHECYPGIVKGWKLRFWSSLPDFGCPPASSHKVSTISPATQSICPGFAYHLTGNKAFNATQLMIPCRSVYIWRYVTVQLQDERSIDALTYIPLLVLSGHVKSVKTSRSEIITRPPA